MSEMKVSDAGLSFVMRWEGTVLKPYKDVAGIWTIGCGHVIKSGESFEEITMAQAMQLLRSDMSLAEAGVNKSVKVPLTQSMFDALCSFAFNVGTGALASSSLLKKLNVQDYAGAADGLLAWCKVRDPKTGQMVSNTGLLNRRTSEKQLFLSQGVAPGVQQPQDTAVTSSEELSPADKAQVESWLAASVQSSVDDALQSARGSVSSGEDDTVA